MIYVYGHGHSNCIAQRNCICTYSVFQINSNRINYWMKYGITCTGQVIQNSLKYVMQQLQDSLLVCFLFLPCPYVCYTYIPLSVDFYCKIFTYDVFTLAFLNSFYMFIRTCNNFFKIFIRPSFGCF